MTGIDASGSIICESSTCRVGYTALGNSNVCFKLSSTNATYEQATNSCFNDGGSLCNIDELTYACSNRVSLGLNFLVDVYLWTASAVYKNWLSEQRYVGYRMYRLTSGRCISPFGPNSSNINISWTSGANVHNYACCVDKGF
jgi:hypothetical protein